MAGSRVAGHSGAAAQDGHFVALAEGVHDGGLMLLRFPGQRCSLGFPGEFFCDVQMQEFCAAYSSHSQLHDNYGYN